MAAGGIRIGIDLGGTKMEALALGGHGEELYRERRPTPKSSYADIVEAVSQLVWSVEAKLGDTAHVGMGIPGIPSPATGLIKNANTTLLIGHPLQKDLSDRLEREVRLANDANCFVLSEASDGAASPEALGVAKPTVFGVIVGTGTGGGVVVNGQLLVGVDAIAGEWGHNSLPWPDPEQGEVPGPKCWCGLCGCIETYLSGPGVARDHQLHFGGQLAAREIGERAALGEEEALATWGRYEGRLARALASIINVFNPDAVVLGGGLSNLARLYTNVPKLWERFVFSDVVSTRLLKAKYGDSSGVRGAAWLWPSEVEGLPE